MKKPKGDGKKRMYQLQSKYSGKWSTDGKLYKRRHDAVGHMARWGGPEDDLDNYRLAIYELEPVEVVPGRILAGKGKMVRLKGKPTDVG